MGKSDHRGKGSSSQRQRPMQGLKSPNQQVTPPAISSPSSSTAPQTLSAAITLRSADHERATACLDIKFSGKDPKDQTNGRKDWTQSLAALPMAIRVQGLARTVALAKDSDWEACKSLLKVLNKREFLEISSADLAAVQPDKNDGTDTARRDIVKTLLGISDIAGRRRLEHEAIEHAGWLKALNPVEKKAQEQDVQPAAETAS